MKKRKGFTLMEIVVAMLLATVISTTVATMIGSSFRVVSDNETFRNEKIFVDKAYELLRDEIANATEVQLANQGTIIPPLKEGQKIYRVQGSKTAQYYGRILVQEYEKKERLLYPIGMYRNEKNVFKLAAKINDTNKAVLELKLEYYGNGETTQENYKYGLSSSVRVNLLARNSGSITTIPEGNISEFVNPIIIITK